MENMEGMEGMGGEGMEGGMTDPGMEGGSKGFPWWGWVIGAGALGGGGFFGFKKLKSAGRAAWRTMFKCVLPIF